MADASVKIAAKKRKSFILVLKPYGRSYFSEDHEDHKAKDWARPHLKQPPDDCDTSWIVADI